MEKCRKSSTHDRRKTFYPTPQNDIKLDKLIAERAKQNVIISRNSLINDAIEQMFLNLPKQMHQANA